MTPGVVWVILQGMKAETVQKPRKPRKKAKKVPKERRLTIKQRTFVKELTDPTGEAFGNGSKAAGLAGYKGEPGSSILRSQACENLTKPNVNREIESALDTAGATREKIGQTVAAALDAEKRSAFFDREGGKVVYGEEEPDHANRLRGADLAAKIRGDILPHRTIERREMLMIQKTTMIVPLLPPAEEAEMVDAELVRVVADS